MPLVYKCTARSAVGARAAGWRVLRTADEAVIDPTRFTLTAPCCRQLRRKLRRAAGAGVTVQHASHLPLQQMALIDAKWCAARGGARGLTMGRFCPAYLSHQRVYLAYCEDRLMGFASFHTSTHELCLDLMRAAPDAPDGTMHALIHAAIADAAAEGRRRLSLAALPARPAAAGPVETRLRRAIARASGGPGLARFKLCFAPRLEPLYAAAPSAPSLALGLADLALAVRRPPNALHDDHAAFEIAPGAQI